MASIAGKTTSSGKAPAKTLSAIPTKATNICCIRIGIARNQIAPHIVLPASDPLWIEPLESSILSGKFSEEDFFSEVTALFQSLLRRLNVCFLLEDQKEYLAFHESDAPRMLVDRTIAPHAGKLDIHR